LEEAIPNESGTLDAVNRLTRTTLRHEALRVMRRHLGTALLKVIPFAVRQSSTASLFHFEDGSSTPLLRLLRQHTAEMAIQVRGIVALQQATRNAEDIEHTAIPTTGPATEGTASHRRRVAHSGFVPLGAPTRTRTVPTTPAPRIPKVPSLAAAQPMPVECWQVA
jgi:hypothetical protein